MGGGIPGLLKGLRFIRRNKGKIRLVIRIAARHDFQIGAVLIGQVTVPYITELPASPGKKLFAHRNVMIRPMHCSPLSSVIEPGHKIII